MGTPELKANLHKLVDHIDDERLLRALHSFLSQHETAEEGKMWKDLTYEQKEKILKAYDESEDESNLINWKDVKRLIK